MQPRPGFGRPSSSYRDDARREMTAKRFNEASRPSHSTEDGDEAGPSASKRAKLDNAAAPPSAGHSGVGQQMLMKLGWSHGKGLGKDEQGRTAPVEARSTGTGGVGKDAFDASLTSATTSSNRTLESERIATESPAQREERLARVQERERQKADVREAIEKFKCVICDKQYLTIGQYEEHCKTYEHHHRARNVAAKQEAKEALAASGELDRRREKERKREEKELRKMMGAAGVPVPAAVASSSASEKAPSAGLKKGGAGFKSIGFKASFKPIALSSSTASALSSTKPHTGPSKDQHDEDDGEALVPKRREAIPTSSSNRSLSSFKSGGIIDPGEASKSQ